MPGYNDLRASVEGDGGLLTTTMETLKDIQGAGRLGVNVREAISKALASHGLGHLPAELPANQWEEVRLYRLGTLLSDVVDAVAKPSAKGDEVLRTVSSSDSQETLRKIRELVCG